MCMCLDARRLWNSGKRSIRYLMSEHSLWASTLLITPHPWGRFQGEYRQKKDTVLLQKKKKKECGMQIYQNSWLTQNVLITNVVDLGIWRDWLSEYLHRPGLQRVQNMPGEKKYILKEIYSEESRILWTTYLNYKKTLFCMLLWSELSFTSYSGESKSHEWQHLFCPETCDMVAF